MDQAGVADARKTCYAAIVEHPAGKAFYTTDKYKKGMPAATYAAFKRIFDEDIDDCALDRVAKVKAKKDDKVNRQALIRNFCWTISMLTPKKDNAMICSLVKLCVGGGGGLIEAPHYMTKARK